MLSDKEEKFCLLLKNGQHVLDLKKFETSVPRPVHWAGQMSSASPYSVIQHLLFEISVVTFIWVKYVNRTRLGFWWLTTDPKYVSAPDCSFGSGSLSLGRFGSKCNTLRVGYLQLRVSQQTANTDYSLWTSLKKKQYFSHFAAEDSEVQKFDLSTGHTRNLCQRWVWKGWSKSISFASSTKLLLLLIHHYKCVWHIADR